MENASKALLMAAGVLIGIMILTIAAYLYSVFSTGARGITDEMNAKYIQEYNNVFMNYASKDDNTIYDIISARNYAIEKNKRDYYYNYTNDIAQENNNYIDVYIAGSRIMNINNPLLQDSELIKNNADKTFRCKLEFNNSGLAMKLTFTQN